MKGTKLHYKLPVLCMKGLVVFPDMVIQFDVGRSKSVKAVKYALSENRLILLVTQRDFTDEITEDKLYSLGTVARIRQVINDSDDGIKIQVDGLYRAEINSVEQISPFIIADVIPCKQIESTVETRDNALVNLTIDLFAEYLSTFRNKPNDIMFNSLNEREVGALTDYLASNTNLAFDKKQLVLEKLDPNERLRLFNDLLIKELSLLRIESEIMRKTQEKIDDNQREYFLREQLRVISNELGEDDSPEDESNQIREKINSLDLPKDVESKLLKECDKLRKMPFGSHEANVLSIYLDTCLDLPWNKKSKETIYLNKARRILDRDHFGLRKVKERFIEILAVRKLSESRNSQIVCLVGPPGVGKTSIAKSVAESLGRKYARVSLGGIQDEADIMGHRRTYVGSMPGRIINAIKQAGTKNPLILLDEIDKLGQSFKGDPSSALLEILDPEQNKSFYDHYIDLPFDLSDVLFITTANDANAIPRPLYDRMDVIELGSYTAEEKFHIAKNYLIPKQLIASGIQKNQLKISAAAIRYIIDAYTKEAGVRNLERSIAQLCRKVAIKIVEEDNFEPVTVNISNIEAFLGPRKYNDNKDTKSDEIGYVNGLAWTSAGGELLPIEVAIMPGNGKVQLTGSLGDVMKESAAAAITCTRVMSEALNIDKDFYKNSDIHIHAPEGAIPKDGPSAGVAMTLAIVSALCKRPIKHDVAMTGEITIQGRVLPIGGLKEKSMAAYMNGIKTVLIPEDNVSDLSEIDEMVKKNVNFIPLRRFDDAVKVALV